MRHFHYTVIWQSLARPGLEYCHLSSHDEGWQLKGTAVSVFDNNPLQVSYRVLCNYMWQTRTVNVEMSAGSVERSMRIIVDKRHRWWAERKNSHKEIKLLRGCVDIDLGITPATNTLPIRRAPLAVGSSVEITTAWVRFPELEIEPLAQRYTRLAEHQYRYESGNGVFTAEIVVDAIGMVIYYPDGWNRVGIQTEGELLYPNLDVDKES